MKIITEVEAKEIIALASALEKENAGIKVKLTIDDNEFVTAVTDVLGNTKTYREGEA